MTTHLRTTRYPTEHHNDYFSLRSPSLNQSALCPIYCIFQTADFIEDFQRTLFPFFQVIPWVMAAVLGGGDGGMGQIGQFPLEQWFFEMPPCTRYWTTATVVTSILIQCKVLTPIQLFYTFNSVYYKSQVRSVPLQTKTNSTDSLPVLAPLDNIYLLRPSLP